VREDRKIGVDALPIAALLSCLLGLILAFQTLYQLRRFGAELYMADIVGTAMVREFGPLLTAIILAGRSGSAIAAELGTMVVREEIAALETMGIRRSGYLVLPRLIAISLMAPALTLISMALGIAGALALSNMGALPKPVFWHRVTEVVWLSDFAIGLTKSMLFAWLVGFSGVFAGLRTRGAADSVGQSTTRAVVASIFLVIVMDSIVTSLTATMRASW
jgi:phospholipid/cholesterol/gamma-HCH transport system permease protein